MTVGALLKRYAKRVISPVVDWTGIADRRINERVNGPDRLLIVMYHRVITDPAEDPFNLGMCVTRKTFTDQIAWFRRHFQPIGIDDALARLDRGQPLPPRSVAITFDDGYRDNLLVAAPILTRYKVPATFYVVTGDLDDGRRLWWDEVIAAVARSRLSQIDTESIGLPGPGRVLPLGTLSRGSSLQALLKAIWELPPASIRAVVEKLHQQLQPEADPRLAASRMSPLEVMKLAASGFNIGGHTIHHADPTTLSPAQVHDELNRSRRQLEQIIQRPVSSFAYPDGRMHAGMPEQVRAAGYTHAVSTVRGINRVPFDRFALSRIGMPEAPIVDFKRAIRNVPLISG